MAGHAHQPGTRFLVSSRNNRGFKALVLPWANVDNADQFETCIHALRTALIADRPGPAVSQSRRERHGMLERACLSLLAMHGAAMQMEDTQRTQAMAHIRQQINKLGGLSAQLALNNASLHIPPRLARARTRAQRVRVRRGLNNSTLSVSRMMRTAFPPYFKRNYSETEMGRFRKMQVKWLTGDSYGANGNYEMATQIAKWWNDNWRSDRQMTGIADRFPRHMQNLVREMRNAALSGYASTRNEDPFRKVAMAKCFVEWDNLLRNVTDELITRSGPNRSGWRVMPDGRREPRTAAGRAIQAFSRAEMWNCRNTMRQGHLARVNEVAAEMDARCDPPTNGGQPDLVANRAAQTRNFAITVAEALRYPPARAAALGLSFRDPWQPRGRLVSATVARHFEKFRYGLEIVQQWGFQLPDLLGPGVGLHPVMRGANGRQLPFNGTLEQADLDLIQRWALGAEGFQTSLPPNPRWTRNGIIRQDDRQRDDFGVYRNIMVERQRGQLMETGRKALQPA